VPITLSVTGVNVTGPAVYFDTTSYNLVVSEAVPIGYLAEVIQVKYSI